MVESASLSYSVALVSSAVIGQASLCSMSPVSKPTSIFMMVTPVSASPAHSQALDRCRALGVEATNHTLTHPRQAYQARLLAEVKP